MVAPGLNETICFLNSAGGRLIHSTRRAFKNLLAMEGLGGLPERDPGLHQRTVLLCLATWDYGHQGEGYHGYKIPRVQTIWEALKSQALGMVSLSL